MKLPNRSTKNKKPARGAKAAKVTKATKTTKVSKSSKTQKKVTLGGLRKFNLGMAVLHLAQGVAVLLLSDKTSGIQPIGTSYLTSDKLSSQVNGAPVLVNATHHLFDLKLAYLVAAFFFISAIAHLVVATRYRSRYESDLKEGVNRFRWVEYSISASTMMVGIALLTGIFEFSSLLMIFALTAIMNLMGLMMELHNRGAKVPGWASFKVGVLAGIVPWLVIVIYFLGAILYGQGGIPGFVYWIYGSLFIFFNCFAVNMYLQYKKKGRWADYLYGERAYIILSLVAKSALAWQIFAGALRP